MRKNTSPRVAITAVIANIADLYLRSDKNLLPLENEYDTKEYHAKSDRKCPMTTKRTPFQMGDCMPVISVAHPMVIHQGMNEGLKAVSRNPPIIEPPYR